MNKENLIKNAANWLSNGAGLPLDVRENEKRLFAYTEEGEEFTKNESDSEDFHALVLIGNVKDFPKLNVPLFAFGYEGGQPHLTEKEEDEAFVVDGLADDPYGAVKNALDFIKFEFDRPAKGDRPKFLVVAEYPLLAALVLGKMTWIDFYFRSNLIIPKTEKEVDLLISAYVCAVALSRNGGLKLDPDHLLARPSIINMLPLIKEHCAYLRPEIIKKAGITSLMLNQEIELRKAALSAEEQ